MGAKVGLVHGKMKAAERDAAMAAFKAGETQLLVATTVIEVGVDVPEATIMVVEHAERFGLAQLHQLRGRVGPRQRQSPPASWSIMTRWAKPPRRGSRPCARPMTASSSPKRICACAARAKCWASARAGWRNSAWPISPAHADLLAVAHDDARLVLARDPDLKSPRGEALRVLLYLFGRDEAVRYLRTG